MTDGSSKAWKEYIKACKGNWWWSKKAVDQCLFYFFIILFYFFMVLRGEHSLLVDSGFRMLLGRVPPSAVVPVQRSLCF